eukprot:TRINITY_DN28684_c0_g1_i1.p1 TRINITY_DN28684_c0_g1~~TRINITY_DN28684_c0_g1_i1.p1  ORF type:complete len:568 (+),score=92.88 TRINITY_DN28684_c0_g1_i1:59-1762(+)
MMKTATAAAMLLSFAASEELKELPAVRCVGGAVVDIKVEARRVNIDNIVSFNTRVYKVNGVTGVPASTIIMQAGEYCELNVTNNLVGTACGTEHSNTFHCSDTTTLHTHGLHVSPYDDNIDTHVEPNGDYHTYTYSVPDYHLMGTHWYHAHHHGSTALQAQGGMAGILLVEPNPSYQLPADLLKLYENPKIPPMMLNHINFGGSDAGAGGFLNIFSFFDQEGVVDQYDDITVPLELEWNDERVKETGKDFYVVNGQYNPTVTVVAEDATLIRMSHAGDYKHLCLVLEGDHAKHCTLTLLARDGVFHRTPYLTMSTVILTQGTRVDFSVFCSSEAAGHSVRVSASTSPPVNPSSVNTHYQHSVFEIAITSKRPSQPVNPIPTSEAPLPSNLQSLMDVPAQKGGERGVETITLGLALNFQGRGVNGRGFPGWQETDEQRRYVEEFCLDKVYELELTGAPFNTFDPDGPVLSSSGFHPYHHHINHFQIKDGNDHTGMAMRNGEWRDIVPAWAQVGTTIRFKPVKYEGDVVIHCHLLQHEDNGMMALYKVKNCPSHPIKPGGNNSYVNVSK